MHLVFLLACIFGSIQYIGTNLLPLRSGLMAVK